MIYSFWGVSGHWPAWFPTNEFYLISAASLWSEQRGTFIRRSYPSPRTRMFLDGGGFSFFSIYAEYPFTPDQFFHLVSHPYYGYGPLIWVPMDYPCEDEVYRSHNLMSNRDRIEATLDHLAWFDRQSQTKSVDGLLPVVQGYTVEERLFCLESMIRRGLARPYMGLGSLCVCNSVAQIDQIVFELGRYAKWHIDGFRGFHLFGVKLNYLYPHRRGLPYVFSFDTSAWSLGQTGQPRFCRRSELPARFERYVEKWKLRRERLNGTPHFNLGPATQSNAVRPPQSNKSKGRWERPAALSGAGR